MSHTPTNRDRIIVIGLHTECRDIPIPASHRRRAEYRKFMRQTFSGDVRWRERKAS